MKQKIIRPLSRIHTRGVLRDGQSLEEFLRKAMQGKEPIQATAKLTYNDRKDGVLPQHDIRTDRWELAQEQTTAYHMSRAAQQKMQDFGDPKLKAAQEAATAAAEAAKNGQPIGEA